MNERDDLKDLLRPGSLMLAGAGGVLVRDGAAPQAPPRKVKPPLQLPLGAICL